MAQSVENGSPPGLVSDAARDLKRELARQGGRKWLRRGLIVAVLIGIVAGVMYWRQATAPPPPPRFLTEALEVRDIVEQVQSTGSVRPVTEVQVGAQVSGRVVKVHADFNSTVKKGDLLAEIDPSLLGAQVSQSGAQLQAAKASLSRAEARLATAKITLGRMKSLNKEGIASSAELDQAQGDSDIAVADVAAARAQISQLNAQLKSARTTLAYTRIYSPIDGIVVDRQVEPGQTVAASFSAPVLFVIAQDLSKMQVLADIDEADVGRLKEKMKADVVVDAFPGQTFSGQVTQIRYAPNNVQGVVTYSAVVDVDNPELKLRPGMTATVTVKTKQETQVLAVKNAALRFRPLPEMDDEGKPKKEKPPPPLEHGQGRVYLVSGAAGAETIEPRVVKTGFTDGVWTVLEDKTLSLGTQVVVEQREEKKRKRFGVF
ncbi:MAG: efflux RND transporter periplasmic adaptor subunit [Polyangiaceae bacterium]